MSLTTKPQSVLRKVLIIAMGMWWIWGFLSSVLMGISGIVMSKMGIIQPYPAPTPAWQTMLFQGWVYSIIAPAAIVLAFLTLVSVIKILRKFQVLEPVMKPVERFVDEL